MKAILYITVAVTSLFLTSCTKSNQEDLQCDTQVTVNDNKYLSASKQKINISNHQLEGTCLTLTISDGGCEGISWEVDLIADSTVGKSNPIQRYIAISFKNVELCEAYITRDFSFDISAIVGSNATDLHLSSYGSIIKVNQ